MSRRQTIVCVEIVGRVVKFVTDTGEEVCVTWSNWDTLPIGRIFEHEGSWDQLIPSEATYDDWVNMLPTHGLRAYYRGRRCLQCGLVVDNCKCGCCVEGPK